MSEKIRALALLSGGLDSVLAARVIMEQGIEVVGIYFSSPFWSSAKKEQEFIVHVASENNMTIKVVPVGESYLDIIKNPSYGWGKGINPCVDCKVFMLHRAKALLEEYNAQFLITGEVVGQRPMSQHKSALNYIEKHAEVRGLLVRPLSGKLLPATIPEEKGWIDREKLLDINGRSRKKQASLAEKFNVTKFTSPAGGCLLAEKMYAVRLKDLYAHRENVDMQDAILLKAGRHFRLDDSKMILGRHHKENEYLKQQARDGDVILEARDCGSPSTLLQENKDSKAIEFAARITAAYSNSTADPVIVDYWCGDEKSEIAVTKGTREDFAEYNVNS